MTTLEEDKEEIGKIQSFYHTLTSSTFDNDPLLKLFKRLELDATMAASSNGSYHSYWTSEKIGDLNNLVDKEPNCSQKIKDIFSGSRNLRIRGNRIGQAIFDRVKELMGSSPPTDSAPPPSSSSTSSSTTTEPTNNASAPPPTQSSETLLFGMELHKYEFAPDLPATAQLRVRSLPSMDGDVMGTVSGTDVIMGNPRVRRDDWLRVQIEGWEDEAWILIKTNDKVLLVGPGLYDAAVAAPQPVTAVTTPPRPVHKQQHHQPQTQPQPHPIQVHQSQSHMASPLRPMTTPGGQPSRAPALYGNDASMYANPLGMSMPNMSMMMQTMQGPDPTLEGQPVPYELYRRLEIRVNRLEAELNNLKMCLRSI